MLAVVALPSSPVPKGEGPGAPSMILEWHCYSDSALSECDAILRGGAQVKLRSLRIDRLQRNRLSKSRDAEDVLAGGRSQRDSDIGIGTQCRNGCFAVVPRAIHFDIAACAQASKTA